MEPGKKPEENSPRAFQVLDAAGVKALFDSATEPVVVVNFWATWCPPCVEEMPDLVRFYSDYEERGVRFLSLSVDHPTTIEDRVRPYVEREKLPFPVHVLDIADPAAIAQVLDVADWTGAVPGTFVYNAERKLVQHWVEGLTYERLAETVEPIVEK